MTPAKRLFDEDQEEQIIDAYMAGETVQKLAEIWGSEKAIRNILKRAGIKKQIGRRKRSGKSMKHFILKSNRSTETGNSLM